MMKNKIYYTAVAVLSVVVIATFIWVANTVETTVETVTEELERDPDTGARLIAYDADDLLDAIEWHGYASFVDEVAENKVLVDDPDKDLLECYALSDYFVAAIRYHAFEQAGMTEQAEEQKTIMDEAAAQIGDLTSYKEELDEKLGIEE